MVDAIMLPLSVQHAEISWVLKVIMSHFSLRSCLDINTLFQCMFPDLATAEKFQLSKTKCAYYINYGLAPYFRGVLLSDIGKSPVFSLLFDESLNRVLQQEQMDSQIRFWCDDTGRAITRYFYSSFLHRPNADNIVSSINEVLWDLQAHKNGSFGYGWSKYKSLGSSEHPRAAQSSRSFSA